jgi:hypothetical protein
MKPGIAWHKMLLALSIAGISLGAAFFSGGACGGGGGGGHYMSQPYVSSR